MGALIGGVLGLIILGIMALVRSSKAKAHAAGMQQALSVGGTGGRAALDKRLPAARSLFGDVEVARQSERIAALATLGELDAVDAEMAAYAGSTLHVATARSIGRVALALHGRDPAGQLAALEADVQALAAQGTNKLSLRAVASLVPVVRALGGAPSPTEAERAEALRFQPSPVIQRLLGEAFAKADARTSPRPSAS
ncbi:MAG: hypothetical protein U1F43_02090 [Myxococcota bacterium]